MRIISLKEINKLILNELNVPDVQFDSYSFSNMSQLESIKDFNSIAEKEVLSYTSNNELDHEILNQILIALAIDSEGVLVEDMIERNFKGKNFIDLIIFGLAHPWKDVRWKALEILGRSKFENIVSLLFYSLKKEQHTYVLRVGLKILSEFNVKLAKEIAELHLKSEDSYLRILCSDIIDLP